MSLRIRFVLLAVLFLFFLPAGWSGQQSGPPVADRQATQGTPKTPPTQTPAAPSQSTAVNSANQDLPGAAWTLLESGTASSKARSRSDALSALTVLDSDRRAVALIEGALGDKDETIRVLAATSLGDIKARSSIPKLKDVLDDTSAQVSFAAAQALWKMGDRSGRDIFYEVLDGERKTSPGPIKSKVRTAKKDMHDPKAIALIGINEASGAFLGPFSMGVSMIEEYAKNTSAPVQAVCAQLLAMDDSHRTTVELEDALWDKNWAVRAAAARALARLNDRKAVTQLKDMMENDKQEPARFVAAAAIIRLNGSSRTTIEHRVSPAAKPAPPKGDANKSS